MLESSLLKIIVVIFREFMEIALLISIILAATSRVKISRIYVVTGILLGSVGASLIAFFTQNISNALGGMGQEIFDAAVLCFTCVIIIMTICWMQTHRNVIDNINNAAANIDKNLGYKVTLIGLVASTIFREGAEIILFVYSIVTAHKVNVTDYLLSLIIAGFAGTILGILIYRGLLKFAQKYIFKVSSILLSMIAASLLSEAVKLLASCGIIDVLTDPLWDLGWLISDRSTVGAILKILVGYNSTMTKIELIAYLSVLLVIFVLSRITNNYNNKKLAPLQNR